MSILFLGETETNAIFHCFLFCFGRFDASTDLSFFRKFANGSDLGIHGSAHIEDMCHIFRLREWEPEIEDKIYNVLELDSTAGAVSKRLIKMIANFVSWG